MQLEMTVQSLFHLPGQGSVLAGTVTAGRIDVGQRILVASPARVLEARVLGIETLPHGSLVTTARSGQEIALSLAPLDLAVLADGGTHDDQGRPQAANLVVRAPPRPWWQFW